MKINVVLDTSSFIKLEAGKRIGLLGELEDHAFHITDSVGYEIRQDAQAAALFKAVRDGLILLSDLKELKGLEVYATLRERIDPGESSCLALAHHNGWCAATDDRDRMAAAVKQTIGKDRAFSAEDIVDMLRKRLRSEQGRSEIASAPASKPVRRLVSEGSSGRTRGGAGSL